MSDMTMCVGMIRLEDLDKLRSDSDLEYLVPEDDLVDATCTECSLSGKASIDTVTSFISRFPDAPVRYLCSECARKQTDSGTTGYVLSGPSVESIDDDFRSGSEEAREKIVDGLLDVVHGGVVFQGVREDTEVLGAALAKAVKTIEPGEKDKETLGEALELVMAVVFLMRASLRTKRYASGLGHYSKFMRVVRMVAEARPPKV